MTPEIVTAIFEGLEEWERTGDFSIGDYYIVSESRADIIRENCNHKDIRKEAAEYYININPFSNWGHLAMRLYRAGINIFKSQFPIPKGNHCDWRE